MENKVKNDKVIILTYFGSLPNYFPIFVDSCRRNTNFDFIYITDQEINTANAENIHTMNISFSELRSLIESRLGSEFILRSPYKLCDYKPAYGKIFEEFICEYNYWGHCDADMIFGHIGDFISEKDFIRYNKLLTKGHLAFYKNNREVNEYFLLECKKSICFKMASKYEEPCFFDEIAIRKILKSQNITEYENNCIADVLPQYLKFSIVEYDDTVISHKDQIFYYEDGKISRAHVVNNKMTIDTFMYIHLQKRAMILDENLNVFNRIYIQPNIFSNIPEISKTSSQFLYRIKYAYKQMRKINLNRVLIKLNNLGWVPNGRSREG